MKLKLYILLCILFIKHANACHCPPTINMYDFFKEGKNLFVGEYVATTENSEYFIYEFKVLNKLRGDFKNAEFVYTSKSGMCTFRIGEGKIFLIQVNPYKGKLYAGPCSFVESGSSKMFKEDTMLLRLFNGKNFTVASNYFKGSVVNGKRSGFWYEYFNDSSSLEHSGVYINDKKDGAWISYGDTTIYRHGKFIKRISNVPDDGKVYRKVKTKKESIMYFADGSIYKRMTHRHYRVYYPNGVLKESVSINKHGFFYKTWNKYNPKGELKESIKLKNNNEIDSWNYCCYDD